jgi:hypothetical protein
MIVQGDNGTHLKLYIRENETPVDLQGSTVEVKIKQGRKYIYKQAVVTGEGICEVVLTSEDVEEAGFYSAQATVIFSPDACFSSDVQEFRVREKL